MAVRSGGPTRIVIAGAVLLLHAVALLALLRTTLGQRPQLREAPIWLNFQPARHPPATKPGRRVEHRRRLPNQPAPSSSTRPSDVPVFSLPSEPDRKNLSGLHDPLLDCAPENFAKLDDAQRSRCGKLGAFSRYDPSAVDYADHIAQVPGVRQWERELARKNAPLLLPCGNATAFDPVYTGACIVGTVANGFTFKKQYENQRAYFDKPGKPRMMPMLQQPGGSGR